jgi:hypothetical protein
MATIQTEWRAGVKHKAGLWQGKLPGGMATACPPWRALLRGHEQA